MIRIESYLAGQWQAGNGEADTLVDPATLEPIAECSTAGLDLGAAARHAREVGGPALRAMTLPERAAALKALSAAIHEQREELIELSIQNGGGTRGDAKFDLDGATGTLAAYASMGKRLPARSFLTDGDGDQLGRTPRFWGEHVWVPRAGVAVHLNAFNFPGWGMAEKLACAILAGVPVIEKPAPQTALIAERIARLVVGSGALPEGAFQFLAGQPGDLLDHLGPQDMVAFTGSAKTGQLVRSHPNLLANSVRVRVEADSVNAHVLADDAENDSAAYDQFLQNIVTDLTQKAGQKCTAVRRILVPEGRIEEVVEDLKGQVERLKVGNGREKDTRIAALTDQRQLEAALAGIEELKAHAEVVTGGERVGDTGAFLAPTLLVAKDGEADVLHSTEVFGPVSTIVPYDGSAESATRLVNRGGGGLVCALYSNDVKWTEAVTLGVAPWHGRVWIGSDRLQGQGLPPSLVLPMCVHGGPGRAGGGEELGGLRGLQFYMQRTSIQGFQGLVQKRFGAPATEEA